MYAGTGGRVYAIEFPYVLFLAETLRASRLLDHARVELDVFFGTEEPHL
jgi:hypothetical protein